MLVRNAFSSLVNPYFPNRDPETVTIAMQTALEIIKLVPRANHLQLNTHNTVNGRGGSGTSIISAAVLGGNTDRLISLALCGRRDHLPRLCSRGNP